MDVDLLCFPKDLPAASRRSTERASDGSSEALRTVYDSYEPIPGPATDRISALARQFGMVVAFGMVGCATVTAARRTPPSCSTSTERSMASTARLTKHPTTRRRSSRPVRRLPSLRHGSDRSATLSVLISRCPRRRAFSRSRAHGHLRLARSLLPRRSRAPRRRSSRCTSTHTLRHPAIDNDGLLVAREYGRAKLRPSISSVVAASLTHTERSLREASEAVDAEEIITADLDVKQRAAPLPADRAAPP